MTLGDGNWKMGDGKKVGRVSRHAEGPGEAILLEHYICERISPLRSQWILPNFIDDIINTLIHTLNTLTKTRIRPALGSIFLLNNISYVRARALVSPLNPSLPILLSQPTQVLLDSNFRIAKAGYFDSNFSPLMQALADDPKDKGGGKAKDKISRFFDLLEEVMERHRMAKVLEDDEEGREILADEVVKLVVPSLQRFTQKHKEKEFSKSEWD
jgi:exocyst complex component 7